MVPSLSTRIRRLPKESELIGYKNAVAGHNIIRTTRDRSLLVKLSREAELNFYQSLAKHPERGFSKYVAAFHGSMGRTQPSDETNKPIHKLVIENIEYGFDKPNILDLKLGQRLWADVHDQRHREKFEDRTRCTTSGPLGLCIAGMKVWNGKGYKSYDKFYGRSLKASTISQGFAQYFLLNNHRDLDLAIEIIGRFTREAEGLQQAMRGQESRMYGSSLLLVYEGNNAVLRGKLRGKRKQKEGLPKVVAFKVIDFSYASWTPGAGPDTNVLFGIERLIGILRQLSLYAKRQQARYLDSIKRVKPLPKIIYAGARQLQAAA